MVYPVLQDPSTNRAPLVVAAHSTAEAELSTEDSATRVGIFFGFAFSPEMLPASSHFRVFITVDSRSSTAPMTSSPCILGPRYASRRSVATPATTPNRNPMPSAITTAVNGFPLIAV